MLFAGFSINYPRKLPLNPINPKEASILALHDLDGFFDIGALVLVAYSRVCGFSAPSLTPRDS